MDREVMLVNFAASEPDKFYLCSLFFSGLLSVINMVTSFLKLNFCHCTDSKYQFESCWKSEFFFFLNHLHGLIKLDWIKRVVSVGFPPTCRKPPASPLVFHFSHLSLSCFIAELYCSFKSFVFPTSSLPFPVPLLQLDARMSCAFPSVSWHR